MSYHQLITLPEKSISKFSCIVSNLLIGCLIVGMSTAGADNIPQEPLHLSAVLQYADNPNPFTRGAELDYEAAQADASFHQSSNQFKFEAIIVPQTVDRAAPKTDNSLSDGYATLRLSHPVHDFGRRKAAGAEAAVQVEMAQHQVNDLKALKKIEIMRRYFDVLIADLDYGVKNEKMTLAFLRYNRYQEQFDMHEAHAEVDVLDLETIYREKFLTRQEASFNRRSARRNLGLELGFTDYVPRDLETPDLSAYVEREVPEFEQMLEQILAKNFEMKHAQLNLDRAVLAAKVTDSKYQPQLDAFLEATEWEEETGSRNSASVGLRFRLPLAAGKNRSRDRQMSQIEIERARAALVQAEHNIRKRAFHLWKELSLHHVNLAASDVRLNFRDQYMDRARTLYELEEQSDLGDAQAELLRAFMENQLAQFNLALTWSEIDALMGNPVYPY